MKRYKVKATPEARQQLNGILTYVRKNLNNLQAARSLRDDYRATISLLKNTAGSFAESDHPLLAKKHLRKIHLKRHDYIILYRLKGDIAEVVNIYHDSQDYENY